MAIQTFSDHSTEIFYKTGKVKKSIGWQDLSKIVARKLDMIHFAAELSDLLAPPNNKLESLKSNLRGCHSIRVNDQWRIVFVWKSDGAHNVRVMDYHK